uniref:MATH domain-containing protein n=1 Tax=Panagrolaimus sp. ES5 TaxID=591445 RepID=A0AC34FL51_9BILA
MANKRKYANDQSYPISMDWIISKEKLIKNKDKVIVSQNFAIENLSGVEFYFSLDQKYMSDSTEKIAILFNLKMSLNMRMNAEVRISCQTAEFDSQWKKEFTNGKGNGSFLCQSAELFDPEKRFIVNNQLIISFKATLTVLNTDPIVPKLAKHESLGWKLWENEDDKDATIVVHGMELKVCHFLL